MINIAAEIGRTDKLTQAFNIRHKMLEDYCDTSDTGYLATRPDDRYFDMLTQVPSNTGAKTFVDAIAMTLSVPFGTNGILRTSGGSSNLCPPKSIEWALENIDTNRQTIEALSEASDSDGRKPSEAVPSEIYAAFPDVLDTNKALAEIHLKWLEFGARLSKVDSDVTSMDSSRPTGNEVCLSGIADRIEELKNALPVHMARLVDVEAMPGLSEDPRVIAALERDREAEIQEELSDDEDFCSDQDIPTDKDMSDVSE